MKHPFTPLFELVKSFLFKLVIVETEGCTVMGKLIGYSSSNREGHAPSVLILENDKNRMLLRGNWTAIKSLEVKAQ